MDARELEAAEAGLGLQASPAAADARSSASSNKVALVERQASPAAASARSRVASDQDLARPLPDLTDRIKELGLAREYAAFRSDYLMWRRGWHRGAKGEHTAAGLRDRPLSLGWLGAYSEWQFRRTTSYWVAVFFLEGSLIFTFTSFFGNGKKALGAYYHPLTSWSVLVGGVFYILGTYLMCVETVNLNRATMKWSPFASKEDFDRWRAMGLQVWPYVASISYFVGAVVYAVPIVADLGIELLAAEVPAVVEACLIQVPFVIGGLLFTVGGVAECIDNGTFGSWPATHGWWGALINFLGGAFFLAAGLVGPLDAWAGNVLWGVGSLLFSLGGGLMVIMWKDEQFGLTFLAALNHLKESGLGCPQPMSNDADIRRFSLRGLIFILVYVFIATLSVMNFNMALESAIEVPSVHGSVHVYNAALPFVLMHMALVMMSAVVRTPKATPYHQLIIGLRYLMLTLGVNCALTFCQGVLGHHLWSE